MEYIKLFKILLWIFFILCVYGQDADKSRCPSLSLTYSMKTYNNKCFQFYYGSKTWKGARTYCKGKGGRLAMVNDPDTNNFLKDVMNGLSWNTEKIWIGLSDMATDHEWKWQGYEGEADAPLTWSNWDPEHPGGWFHTYRDCVVMEKDGGSWTWHEAMCNTYPWEYRFICEYEMEDPEGAVHGVDGSLFRSTTKLTTVPTTSNVQIHSRPGGRQSEPPVGGHRWVTDSDGQHNLRGDLGGLTGGHLNTAESNDSKDGHVPVYALVLAFGAGLVFATFIIVFVVLRRRRRKKHSDAYPSVVYQAQPGGPGDTIVAVGAVGSAPTCGVSGKPCKAALDAKSKDCVCIQEHNVVVREGRNNRKLRTSNVYVEVDTGEGATASGVVDREPRTDSPDFSQSACSSVRDITSIDEAPPTYDEACAGIVLATEEARAENIYAVEPVRAHESVQQSNSNPTNQGAIPKTSKKGTVTAYLPMSGKNSPRDSPVLGHRRQDSANQYVPMSLGELPPIPTDEGYEIPVSSKLKPETIKQINQPASPSSPITNDGTCPIYSEIPANRQSRIYKNTDEEIYHTID